MSDPDGGTASAAHFFLGRQPILDHSGVIHGYELLFRSSDHNAAQFTDDHHATIQVITRAFSELGLQAVVGEVLSFVNLDKRLLTSRDIDALPPERMVLEILENTPLTGENVASCARLHEKGYPLALDDVNALAPDHAAILPYVSYIKIDLAETPEDSLDALVDKVRPMGIALLAEKVETRAQYEYCRKLGFDYFQGYYFARPEILSGKSIEPSKQQLLRLSNLLMGDAEDAAIEAVFKEDSKLTYNLLRLVNSVAMGMRTRINSVHHAMMLLGRKQLQRWMTLLLFAHREGRAFPDPLSVMAACRGRFMELLAKDIGCPREMVEQAFMTGIMSLLDAALEIPMDRIVSELNLAQSIRLALMEREGKLGALLKLIEDVEQCDTACVSQEFAELGLTIDQLTAAEIEAMRWANSIGKEA